MQLIPGGGGIMETVGALTLGKKAVGTPSIGQPTEPPPTREDPEIAEAKKRQRIADLQRRGRPGSILTSLRGVEGEPTLNRPRASKLLGE